ncbi:MAG: TRAP transporter small permease [Pseudomonadota bacterium]|nr:TRAP transporter small permease [Pseudomonadota bacterium]
MALRCLKRCEEALLVLLLLGMISMAAGQVLLRNFFDGGVYWGDSAVRVMVLWVTMLGAMVASRDDSHIRIDLVGRFLKDLGKPLLEATVARINYGFTCVVLGLFCWASGHFVYYEYLDGSIAFAKVPAWICEAVMPLGSGIMALRYALHVVKRP